MITGNPEVFAIESKISEAYERLSSRALGFFAIHVGARSYGIKAPDATLLSAAFDGVGRRISDRGRHSAPAISDAGAEAIATAYIRACYIGRLEEELFPGIRDAELNCLLQSSQVIWAPDGKEGFDDGSHVLQFDVEDQVRLIAFTRWDDPLIDQGSLRDVWLPQANFYKLLQLWYESFEEEWKSMPKLSDGG